MALDNLSAKGVVELDDERRATMVSNLMVVLCGEREPSRSSTPARSTNRKTRAGSEESLPLRIEPALWEQLERCAAAEFRSVNAEIEVLLREALAKGGSRSHPRAAQARATTQRGEGMMFMAVLTPRAIAVPGDAFGALLALGAGVAVASGVFG
jgi:hypothetical protein